MDSTAATLAAIDLPLGLAAVGLLVIAVTVQLRARRSMRWLSTTGRVSSATVDVRVDGGANGRSTLYCPMIAYEYQVEGRDYLQNRLLIGAPVSSNFRSRAQKWVDRYPEGSAVTVYYNPADPSEAVLERRAGGPVMLFWGAAAILIAVAVVVSLWVGGGAR